MGGIADVNVLAIGGSSHAGKSTVAAILAERWSAELLATDGMARHPGRPWSARGAHVVEYFCSHSVEWLVQDVLAHYERMQPQIAATIDETLATAQGARIVVEGSALLAGGGLVARQDTRCVYLTAPPELLHGRISAATAQLPPDTELATACARFADRAVAFDTLMRRRAEAAGTAVIECVDSSATVARLLALVRSGEM